MAKKKKTKSKKKSSFWQNVWAIICDKKDTNGEITKITLSGMMSSAMNCIAVVLCLCFLLGVFGTVQWALAANWEISLYLSNILKILVMAVLCVAMLFFALILRGCANEMDREKDKNYIVAVFSALTSFVALIVAFVALFKGVR